MVRQNLIKMAMLGLAVLALVYIVSVYNKKQTVNSSGLVDNFDGEIATNDNTNENEEFEVAFG